MKRLLLIIHTTLFCCLAIFSGNLENDIRIQQSKEEQEYLRIRTIFIDDLINNPLTNTIARNQGDTILELYTPSIGDQGSQGSCNAWAMGYGCGSIHAYNTYQDMNWAKRSPAFLFNLNDTNCINNFSEINKIGLAIRDYGICSYYLMPYDEIDCFTTPNSIQLADAALNKMEYTRLNSEFDINEYKQVLRAGYPIAVGTWYCRDLRRVWTIDSLHGFWGNIQDTSTIEGHAMCVVGFNDSIHALKLMNSWDSIKGDHGFVWVSYNLVQNGVFNRAYVFEQGTTGFVPQIEGSSYFCSNEECYQLTNTPSGCTYTWSINSNVYPNDVISSGQGTTNVCISQQGLSPRNGNDTDENTNRDLTPPNLPHAVLSISITDQNSHTYSTSKSIYDPSPKPTVSASNTTTNWTAGTTRTFTITNCNSVSYTNLQWVIQKTVNNFGGNSTIYTDTIYGTYMTYTPTWVTGALSITIDITATNLARHCEDNYVHLSYNVIRKHLLNAIDNGSLLDVTISDEKTTSLLKQTTSNEKNLYTLELWHPIYGQMRKQPAYSTNEQININGLPQGTYILLLKKDYEIIAQTKVIIQ